MAHHLQHPVCIYILSGCPYCKRAIAMLRQAGVPHKALNLGRNPQLAAQLSAETGSQTVPKIFIFGEFIGGADQLAQMMQSGELTQRLHRGTYG